MTKTRRSKVLSRVCGLGAPDSQNMNSRFLVGDFNMKNYAHLSTLLKEAGVENHILAFHAETKPSTERLHFDSCSIIAIGGMLLQPQDEHAPHARTHGRAESSQKRRQLNARPSGRNLRKSMEEVRTMIPALAVYLAEKEKSKRTIVKCCERRASRSGNRSINRRAYRDTEKEKRVRKSVASI